MHVAMLEILSLCNVAVLRILLNKRCTKEILFVHLSSAIANSILLSGYLNYFAR